MVSKELLFGARERSIKLGRVLQIDHPEIVVIYGYYPQGEVAKMLEVEIKYGVKYDIARTGIHYANKGHDGSLRIEAYPGLIPDEKEREWLAREHNELSSRKLSDDRGGMFGRNNEQHSKDSRKSYKAGLAKITPKQRREYAERINPETGERYRVESGRLSVIARGFTPFFRKRDKLGEDLYCAIDEIEYAYYLSLDSKYTRKLIVSELNDVYHDGKKVRKSRSVTDKLVEYRKSLEAKVE